MTAAEDADGTTEGSVRETAVRAPAKLNLGLRVVGRRPDGYHLLESIFVPLDLADDLTLRLEPARTTRVRLTLDGAPPELESDERNLAVRAAHAFLAEAGLALDLSIALTKRIPVGAGLGGGSSDAGAVLRALAAAVPGAVSPSRLPEIALSLGADVPYFLDPQPAQVHGIGEGIEPIAGFPALPVLVATPRPPLATAAVFGAWDGTEPAAEVVDRAALTRGNEGRSMLPPSVAGIWWRRLLTNDLEAVAVSLHPGVARLRTEIERAGALAVGMSGSGPTVFGVFGDAEETRAAAAGIPWEPTDHVHVGMTTGSR